jgi:hypothetical protein
MALTPLLTGSWAVNEEAANPANQKNRKLGLASSEQRS